MRIALRFHDRLEKFYSPHPEEEEVDPLLVGPSGRARRLPDPGVLAKKAAERAARKWLSRIPRHEATTNARVRSQRTFLAHIDRRSAGGGGEGGGRAGGGGKHKSAGGPLLAIREGVERAANAAKVLRKSIFVRSLNKRPASSSS